MAVLKHIALKNSQYSDAVDYLKFQHDEFTNKPILDEVGHFIPREGILFDGINCTPETFSRECAELNQRFNKNNTSREIKAHHYIISFDPRDREDNGLTVEHAQELGMEFCKDHFPGHQALVCTHPDGHNSAGNIHVHIVINSLRMEDIERKPYMERPSDSLAGYKHHVSEEYLEYLKQELMKLCQRENLYQVDLLTPAKIRITDKEYWAARRGQAALDKAENKEAIEKLDGKKPKFETQLALLRNAINTSLDDSHSIEDLRDKLLENYGIFLFENRGRFSYQIPEREKSISARKLGTSFDRPYIEKILKEKQLGVLRGKRHAVPRGSVGLIADIQTIVKAKENPYYARKVKLNNLKEASKTLLFIQENGIKTREELLTLLESTKADQNAKLEMLKKTEAELKRVNLLIRYTGQYYANKKTYGEYLKSKNKKRFREEHESELLLYESARKELKELSNGEIIPTLMHLREEKEKLAAAKNEQYEEYTFARAKHKELQNVLINIDSILSIKKELDEEIRKDTAKGIE